MTFGRPLIFLVDIKIGLKHLEKQLQRLYFRTWLYLFYLIIQIIFIIIYHHYCVLTSNNAGFS